MNNFFYGDNLDSLKKLTETHSGEIKLIYIDPPFNTNNVFYFDGGNTKTISHSKKTIAYSDKKSFSEYLSFLKERFILLHKLLSDDGSIYVHIDLKVGHYVKVLLDEVFGMENFLNDITRIKSNPKNFSRKAYGNEKDVIYFYAKNKGKNIWNEIKVPLNKIEAKERFAKKDDKGFYTTIPMHAPGETKKGESGSK